MSDIVELILSYELQEVRGLNFREVSQHATILHHPKPINYEDHYLSIGPMQIANFYFGAYKCKQIWFIALNYESKTLLCRYHGYNSTFYVFDDFDWTKIMNLEYISEMSNKTNMIANPNDKTVKDYLINSRIKRVNQ